MTKRTTPSDDQSTQQPAAELEQQLAQLMEALQRERADAINYRRRAEDQLGGARDAAKAGVITALLPVIDNFERALKHVPADLQDNDYIKGVQGVVRQFEKTLADLGVQRIETVGKDFDPGLHEAVSMEEGDGAREVITDELQAGYRLGADGPVLRHAMVRVHTEL